MSSEWHLTKLGSLVDIKHGFAFKGEFFSDVQTSYQLTTPGNFAIGGGFQSDKVKFYNGPVPSDFVLKAGDLLVTMTDLSKAADTLGYAAKLPPTVGVTWLHNQRVGLVSLKPGANVSKNFLHYLMRSPSYRHWVVSTATGSTVKHTSPSRICGYEFSLPPLEVQKEISIILESLDDRITLLRASNTTLEAIAQALFKSWFVDFDPIHAKQQGRAPAGMDAQTAALFPDSFEESELGMVPKGWRVGNLGDIAQTIKKQISPEQLHSGLHYVGLEHIPRKSLSLTTWDTAEGLESAKAKFSVGDVLFGKLRPYFHKVVIAPVDGVCSTDILVCGSKKPAYYGLVAMQLFSKELIDYADRLSNGAKMPRVNWSDLAAYPLAIPPEEIASSYTKFSKEIFEKMQQGVHQMQTLAKLRDTLLPRLISGQLRLLEAQALVEQAHSL